MIYTEMLKKINEDSILSLFSPLCVHKLR